MTAATAVCNTTYALSTNWLDTTNATAATNTLTISNNSNCRWCGCYHNYWWTYPVYTSPARPIKLALSEVEKLRVAARKDAKLKAILQKFTDLIEITVDFE